MFRGFLNAGDFKFTIIDGIVVLIFIIAILVGLKKGFINQLFGLVGVIVVVGGAVLLSGVVGGWLNSAFGGLLHGPIENWVNGFGADADPNIFRITLDWSNEAVRSAYMPEVLEGVGLPSILAGVMAAPLNNIFAGFGEAALVDVLADTLTSWAMVAIAFILLLIIFSIAVALLKKVFKGITRIKVFGAIDKFLGIAFGLVKAYLIVSILLALFLLLPTSFPLMSTINSQINDSFLTLALYQNNLIGAWLLTLLA